MSFEKRAWLTY